VPEILARRPAGWLRATLLFLLLATAGLGCHSVPNGGQSTTPATAVEAPRGTGPTLRTLATNGVEIAYDVRGEGSPSLVLIHGWACDRSYWGEIPQRLAQRYQVLTLDLASHGASSSGHEAWDAATLAQDVAAVLEREEIKDAILIGHSMGGDIVLETAAIAHRRVVAVIGVDTYQQVEDHFDPVQLQQLIASMEADYPTVTEQVLRQYFFQPDTDPTLVDRIVADMLAHPPETALPLFEKALQYDLTAGLDRLDQLGVPVRAINSNLVPTDLAMSRRHAADFDAVVLEGLSHFLMLDDADRFLRALDEVLCGLAATDC